MAIAPLGVDVDGRLRLLIAIAEPLLLTALLAWLCLTLHRVLLKVGATWLFDLPPRRGRWFHGTDDEDLPTSSDGRRGPAHQQ